MTLLALLEDIVNRQQGRIAQLENEVRILKDELSKIDAKNLNKKSEK